VGDILSLESAEIAYRYAKGSDNSRVDVLELDSEKRNDLAPYSCIGCGGELIPNLGQVRVKHFCHKSAGTCSGETYLHQLAKEGFLTKYKQCLADEVPFVFEATFPAVCNHFEKKVGQSCKTEKLRKIDLTKYFKSVELEKTSCGFIPDILLSTEDGSEVLFVEIAVSHKCEENKIKSGKRIIEIEITDESDVEQILNGQLKESSSKIKTYNFKKEKWTGDICKGKCHRVVNIFLIYESKKSILLVLPPAEAINKSCHGKVSYHEIFGFEHGGGESHMEIFKRKVREAHFNKQPIKNCFLCRYHAHGAMEDAIFCKFRKEGFSSNEAIMRR